MRPRAAGTVPRAGARAFLDLDRVDLVWLLVLVAGSFVLRFGSPIFSSFGAWYGISLSRCAMQLMRARRLSSAGTTNHGASVMSVCTNISSFARE